MGLSWGYLCFARIYLSLIPVSNSVKDERSIHLCVKHKLIICHDMWFNWVADVPMYVSLICHINDNDPAKLWWSSHIGEVSLDNPESFSIYPPYFSIVGGGGGRQWHSQLDNLFPLCKFQFIIIMHFFRNWLFLQSVNCKYLYSGSKSSGLATLLGRGRGWVQIDKYISSCHCQVQYIFCQWEIYLYVWPITLLLLNIFWQPQKFSGTIGPVVRYIFHPAWVSRKLCVRKEIK